MDDAQDQRPATSTSRRALLKGAAAAGVGAAAFSAPKVSVVPAYGLTNSQGSDGNCYYLTWSSNNPPGKGWLEIGDLKDTNATTGPAADAGVTGDTYGWALTGGFSNLEVSFTGNVNTGGGAISVTSIPTGYKLVVKNGGRAYEKDAFKNNPDSCNGATALHPVGDGAIVTMSTATTGTISSIPGSTATGNGNGKYTWVFDIEPI